MSIVFLKYTCRKLFLLYIIYSFHFVGREATFVFNRHSSCLFTNVNDTSPCKSVIKGILTLRNEENVTFLGSLISSEDENKSRFANVHDPSRHGIQVTIKKSAVRINYDLKYEMEVFSEFYEEVLSYTYKNTGEDSAHFCYVKSVNDCNKTGQFPSAPDGTPLFANAGRCCWCSTLNLSGSHHTESDGGVTRGSKLACSVVDATFKNSPVLFKYCPRILGPWYTGLRIDEWRWDFSIDIHVEWFAPAENDDPQNDGMFSAKAKTAEEECIKNATNEESISEEIARANCLQLRSRNGSIFSTHHQLNVSVPFFYDEKHQLKYRITGSVPETAAWPPSLRNHFLFIPTYPATDPLVMQAKLSNNCGISSMISEEGVGQSYKTHYDTIHNQSDKKLSDASDLKPCLSTAMLIPPELVDPSGNRCDAIGTSLQKWALPNDQFCQHSTGYCMANQLGSLYKQDKLALEGGNKPKYLIHDNSILGSVANDPRFHSSSDTIDLKDETQLFHFSWKYLKEHSTYLEMTISADQVVWIASSTPGEIDHIRSNGNCRAMMKNLCKTSIYVRNTGTIPARYEVSVPYCVRSDVEKSSNELKPIAPSSAKIEPKKIQEIPFYIDSSVLHIGTANYTCKAVLSDSDGKRLDHSLFHIGFSEVKHIYQGQVTAKRSPPANISLAPQKKNQLTDIKSTLGNFFMSLKKLSFDESDSRCNCQFHDFLCLFRNFFGCLSKARTILVSSVGFMGAAATFYIFGPSVNIFLKFALSLIFGLRHRTIHNIREKGRCVSPDKKHMDIKEESQPECNKVREDETHSTISVTQDFLQTELSAV